MHDQDRWWFRPFRAYQSNIREIDATLDVDAAIAHMKDIGADTWLLNAGGIVSFYPTEIDYQYRSPWLAERASGDLIGDAVTAAHANGIRLIARFDFSKLNADIASAHPEWCFRDRNGDSPEYNGLVSTCPSGPYYQERMFDVLDEALERYPLDGLFFNWFHFTEHDYGFHPYDICRCASCVEGFRRYANSELPPERDYDDPLYLEWKQYIASVMSELSTKIRRYVADKNPDIALSLRQDADIAFSEAGNGVYNAAPLWVYSAGDDVLRYRTEDPKRPVWLTTGMFVDMTYRFEVEQQGLLGLNFAQTIAHGGNPCAYQIGIPETIPKGSFDAARRVMRFHRDHAEQYAGAVPGARVAVVTSAETEQRFGVPAGITQVRGERRGITQALRESHIPFTLLPQSSLAAAAASGALARYSAIVLPNVALLGDEDAAALDAYVEAGGGLVVTGSTGLGHPDDGRTEFALASLGATGLRHRRESEDEIRSSYLRVVDVPDREPAASAELLMLDRSFLEVDPRPGAWSALDYVPPSRYGPPEKIYWEPGHETQLSGLLWHRHGAGLTAYFPWPVGALYHDLGLPGHREAIARAVVAASGGERQLEVAAPPHVEVTVMGQQGGGMLLHLVNYSGHRGRVFSEPDSIREIELAVHDGDFVRARSLGLDQELEAVREGNSLRFRLPELGLFDAIVVSRETPLEKAAVHGAA